MARSAAPRKAYKPKAPKIPVIFRHSDSDDRKLKLWPHLALAALTRGDADSSQVNDIVSRMGLAYVQASDRFKDDIDSHKEGQSALRSIRLRHDKTGKWGMTGDEFRIVGKCLNLADEYQEASTRRQLEQDYWRHYALNEMANEPNTTNSQATA